MSKIEWCCKDKSIEQFKWLTKEEDEDEEEEQADRPKTQIEDKIDEKDGFDRVYTILLKNSGKDYWHFQ